MLFRLKRVWYVTLGLIFAAFIVVVAALGSYAVWNARSHALRALAAINFVKDHATEAVSSTSRSQLESELRLASTQSGLAENALYSTVVLQPLSWLPYVGNEIRGARALFADAHRASLVGLSLLQALDSFQRANEHGAITSRTLIQLQRAISSARATMATLNRPAESLFNVVGHDRVKFDQEVRHVVRALTVAKSGLVVAQSLLGTSSPTTILVLGQNNAEMREQGAFLTYNLLRVQNGAVTSLRSGSTGTINPAHPVQVPTTPGLRKYFLISGANDIFQSANTTADFPWTGATTAAMFKSATGISVNDVLALDVPTIAKLLSVTGPLNVPGVTQTLTASNVVTYLLHDLYAQYPAGRQVQREDDLSNVATTLLKRINSNRSSDLSFLRALGQELPGRHLMLWSADPAVESAITKLGASGAIDTVLPTRTFHVAVESDVAAKLDYYVGVQENFDVTLLANGSATVATTVTVKNNASTGQPPSYQLGPDNINSHVAGQYVANVYLWSPRGAQDTGGVPESGLVLRAFSTNVLPQQSSTTYFSSYLPRAVVKGSFVLHLVPQPRLYPASVTVSVHGTGWRVTNSSRKAFNLNNPVTLTFPVTKSSK